MFTVKKKRNYRNFLYGAIVVTLCFLIAVIAWPTPAGDKPEDNEGLTVNAKDSKEDDQSDFEYNKDPIKNIERENDNDNETDYADKEIDDISAAAPSYYLVKNEGGSVKVFFVDSLGTMVELETTEIIYDLLGPDDQRLFDEGITVSSQEELAVLLQDFES